MATQLSNGGILTVTLRWNMPPQTREPRIITIESDPFTARLDGQRRKPCVRHQVATRVGFGTKAREDLPVPLTRLNNHAVGLSKKDVTESEDLIQGGRLRKDLWVGGDADHTA